MLDVRHHDVNRTDKDGGVHAGRISESCIAPAPAWFNDAIGGSKRDF
jgi:hypothetical protein